MQRPPEQGRPDHLARLDRPVSSVFSEPVEPRPQPDVRMLRLLPLHPHQPPDRVAPPARSARSSSICRANVARLTARPLITTMHASCPVAPTKSRISPRRMSRTRPEGAIFLCSNKYRARGTRMTRADGSGRGGPVLTLLLHRSAPPTKPFRGGSRARPPSPRQPPADPHPVTGTRRGSIRRTEREETTHHRSVARTRPETETETEPETTATTVTGPVAVRSPTEQETTRTETSGPRRRRNRPTPSYRNDPAGPGTDPRRQRRLPNHPTNLAIGPADLGRTRKRCGRGAAAAGGPGRACRGHSVAVRSSHRREWARNLAADEDEVTMFAVRSSGPPRYGFHLRESVRRLESRREPGRRAGGDRLTARAPSAPG